MAAQTSGLGNVQLHLIDSVEQAFEFLRWIGSRRPMQMIAIDIETGEYPGKDKKHALSPWHGKIRLVQVGDGEQGWAMDWERWAGVFYQALADYKGPIVFHNVAFEAKWFSMLSDWKFPWHQAHDTMIMSQIIKPNRRTHALKALTAELVDPMAASLQSQLDDGFKTNGWSWGTVPINFQPYWMYGALDPVITTRLALDHFYQHVQPGAVYSIPYELEMATRRIATTMELNGARVDLEYCQQMYDKLTTYTESVKAWALSRYGVSITSNIRMVETFEQLGAEITERTTSGGKSVNKDQIAMLVATGNPEVKTLAQAVLNQRQSDKLASSYFSNFMNDQIDGVLHPSINIMAARTSRMSITEPALQTLPSGDSVVRSAFIPRNEGEVIITSDLDQVEFRLTACFSEDPTLIELFHEADRTGGDVFTSIMRQVYKDNSLEKSDKRRKLIKGVVYGKLYGAGPDKMAVTAGVSVDDMKAVIDAFDTSYPGIKRFQKNVEDEGTARLNSEGEAYVKTMTGRRLPADNDRVYSLTNYKIQATAAEVFKQNLVKLDQQDLTEHMVVPVHDEIVMSVPEGDAKEIMAIVKECMTTTEGWAIPLTSGISGPFKNWGEDKH
jgi:DNA polymerase-1